MEIVLDAFLLLFQESNVRSQDAKNVVLLISVVSVLMGINLHHQILARKTSATIFQIVIYVTRTRSFVINVQTVIFKIFIYLENVSS